MILPRPVNAVVFDMDGLLFDTERIYAEAAIAAAGEVGCSLEMDVFRKLIGTPLDENRRVLFLHYGEDYPFEEMRVAWMRHFRKLIEVDLPVKPGVVELLTLLDDLGLPRAIATSSSHKTVQHHLALHKLAERFHAVVASGDYEKGKPSPDPYLMAAAKLGVEPGNCLALEDSFHGIRSAHGAGMMAVMVPDMLEPTEEIRTLCHVVQSLHDVPTLISSNRPGSAAASS